MALFDFSIKGKVAYDPTWDRELWYGAPYSIEAPAVISAWFGEHPYWRKNWDHDGDPNTPPIDMGPHKGTDIWGLTPWQRLVPVSDGEVIYAGLSSLSPAGGYKVVVDHDGRGFKGWTTWYLHMLAGSISVSVGQNVDADVTELGTEGASGWVTGRHNHFGLRNKEYAAALGQDPRLSGYLNAAMFLREPGQTGPSFLPDPLATGVTLTQFKGGSIAELHDALDESWAESAHITKNGKFLSYIKGAPEFVNAEFIKNFETGVPSGTAMLLGNID